MQKISRYLSLGIIAMMPVGTTHAASAITSASALGREATPVIQSLPTPTARAWATARINMYKNALKSAQRSYSSDGRTYQREVGTEAMEYIRALQNGDYTYTITDEERRTTEATIVSYQKELVRAIREYITQVRKNDTRESGNMHMTFRSGEVNIDIDVEPYTVTQTRDMKNLEIDTGITLRVSGDNIDGKSVSLSLRGKILLAERHLYITLQNYSLNSLESDESIQKARTFLEKIKGKTYHQELDKEMAEAFQDSQKSLESTEKVLKKLETTSLLTPVARQGSDYILMFRKATILDLARLTKTSSIADIQLKNLLIPADLRMSGTTITLNGRTPGLQVSGKLSRDTSGTALLEIDGQERATYDPWKWKLSRTPGYWAFAMSSEEYTVDAKATATSAEATVKEGDKTIVTARIDETGLNAWSYNMQASWEDLSYDWENDTTKTDTITLRVWGALKREFGNFTLTPPTLYEEMSRLQEQLESMSE